VQGTGEGRPFRRDVMDKLLDMAEAGARQMFEAQKAALAEAGVAASQTTG
jgi:ribonuclease PH